MEVHAHTHTARKKWTHYFWEFLMLFLAVFCGFLAENFREHYVEDQRAVKHAKNLYKELVNDSLGVQQSIANRVIKEDECGYFIDYVKDSSLINLSPRFFPAFAATLITTHNIMFEPNDGILNQLRNSGELRYFKNTELQAEIGKLSVKISLVRTRNEKEWSYIENFNRPFSLKHFDFNWYEIFIEQGKLSLMEAVRQKREMPYTGQLMNPDKFSRREAEALASYYRVVLRATRQLQYKEYAEANHRVLELLRKEFHLKQENQKL